jgi:hypothetical protein
LYALTSSGNAFRIPDEFEVYFQVEHLVDAGDLSVPQALAIKQNVVVNGKVVGQQSVFFGKVGRDGKPYAPYGPLSAVLALPHHLIGRALASVAGIRRAPAGQGLAWVIFVGGITMISTATAAALAVVGFHRAATSLGTPPRPALLLSLLLGGATVLWPYATSFFSEAWQACAFVWAAALLIEARSGGERARLRVIVAALLLTVAGLTKVTALVFAPGFVIAVLSDTARPWRTRLEVATALGGGIALAAALHILWNLSRFGSAFDFGYDWAETIPKLPARAFLITDVPHGLATLLFSPGKSVLLWAPVLVLALIGARVFWKRERPLAIGIGASFLIGLFFYASYLFPEGGYSHGPRNLVPWLPMLLLPAAGPDAGRWPRAVVLGVGAVGLVIALLSVSVSFLDDQRMVQGPGGGVVPGYYALVDPPPGRAANRYRLGYVPFINAMRSPGWLRSPNLGQGPDFFFLHLGQARRQLRDGATIPSWIAWAMAGVWLVIVAAASAGLARAWIETRRV